MKRFLLPFLALAGCGDAGFVSARTALDASGYPTAAAYLSCLEGKAAVVSAHRGGPAPGFPENAIETFEHTLSQVPALIETDVRETRDGVFVLLHDETVDRTTNGSGAIADMTLAEVRALRLVDADGQPTDFQIPTLTEALEAMRGRTILQLDVKRGVGLRDVARVVAASDAEAHAAIIAHTANGAIIAAAAGDDISVFATVRRPGDVDDFVARGLPTARLVAWTGIVDEPETGLYDALGRSDISTSGGALGQVDRAARRGDRSAYRALEGAGLDIIVTDRPVDAARQLGVDRITAASQNCAL